MIRTAPAGCPGRAPAASGFTLLEVLVALAILGTAVVVSIQAVGQGLRLLRAAGDQQQAIIVADQKAREVVAPVEGSDSGSTGRFSWERTTRVLETPDLTPADAEQQWRVFRISVVVRWDDQRRLEVSTLRTVPATSDPTRSADPFAPRSGTETPGQGASSRETTGSETTGGRTSGSGLTGTGTTGRSRTTGTGTTGRSGTTDSSRSNSSRFRGGGS